MKIFGRSIANGKVSLLLGAMLLAGCSHSGRMDNVAQQNAAISNGSSENFGADSPGTSQDFMVHVGDRIFFDLDSSQIRPDAQDTLGLQARWLLRYPQYHVVIEGHSDERGTREYNLALGQRRAVAARDYLASLGVPLSRMRVISYGKERPVALCDDITCWNQNRRAVTVVEFARNS